MSFRKEKKICMSISESQLMFARLHKYGLSRLYDDRKVNSIYFDNLYHSSFSDSEEGTLPRKKIRFRWYDENNEKIQLEVKTSSVEGRFKTSEILTLSKFNWHKSHGLLDNRYGNCHQSTLVSYERSYYVIEGLRLTFDQNISYLNLRNGIEYKESEVVFEIKTGVDISDDFIFGILYGKDRRFSKYSRSIIYT